MVRCTMIVAAALIVAVAASMPSDARAQDACASLRHYIAQLDQQVQTGTRTGAPSQQVNHDITLRNRQVQIYQQRCGSAGRGGVSGGGGRGGGLGAAIQMLTLLAPLIDSATRASGADRGQQAEAQRPRLLEELERQRAALAEIARLEALAHEAGAASVRQQAQMQQDADRAWRESQANPFAALPSPSHEIRTYPGAKVETTLVDSNPPSALAPEGCPSDTPGAAPNGHSLSMACMRPRAAPAAPGQAPDSVSRETPGRAMGGDGAIAHIEITNPGGTPVRPRTQAVSRAASREQRGGVPSDAPPGASDDGRIAVSIVNPLPTGTPESGAGRMRVREESGCISVGNFTETFAGADGSSGYFTASNHCEYRVVGAFCFKRPSGGETCGPIGGDSNWSARMAFAYADVTAGRITYVVSACRADSRDSPAERHACVDHVRAVIHARDGGKRP